VGKKTDSDRSCFNCVKSLMEHCTGSYFGWCVYPKGNWHWQPRSMDQFYEGCDRFLRKEENKVIYKRND